MGRPRIGANAECRIDAIAQSWAVISGRGEPERAREAMAVDGRQPGAAQGGLILLLTPPFDKTTPSPGYIQGYVPGVRENGGQYTHGALWSVLAFARLGDGDTGSGAVLAAEPGESRAHAPRMSQRYRAEPYVVAADVYSQPPHTGRGGWTWYTGSAGWMYRVGLEGILGLSLQRGALRVDPCIPRAWPRYELTYRSRNSQYHIVVENPDGVNRGVRQVEVDGRERADHVIPIVDDGQVHHVRVVLGTV